MHHCGGPQSAGSREKYHFSALAVWTGSYAAAIPSHIPSFDSVDAIWLVVLFLNMGKVDLFLEYPSNDFGDPGFLLRPPKKLSRLNCTSIPRLSAVFCFSC